MHRRTAPRRSAARCLRASDELRADHVNRFTPGRYGPGQCGTMPRSTSALLTSVGAVPSACPTATHRRPPGANAPMTTAASKPVVLIAEELAPSTLEVLGDDFEIRHRQRHRPRRAARGRGRRRRPARPHRHQGRRRGLRRRQAAEGRRPRRRRAGQRRRPRRHRARRDGRQRADLEHRLRRRARARAAARHRPAHPRGRRRACSTASGSAASTPASSIQGKTVGVVGLGRIGALFAQRIAAFGTHVIAYDPYLRSRRAPPRSASSWSSSTSCCGRADFITIHLPKTPETLGLIGEEALAQDQAGRPHRQRRARRDRRRGGAGRGRRSGHVAGAGLDVYATEPTTSSPLFELAQVVGHPAPRRLHRGGPGQGRHARRVLGARSALRGELRARRGQRPGRRRGRRGRPPGLPLAEKLGRLFTALAGGPRGSRRGVRRDRPPRRLGARARRPQGRVRRRRRRAGDLRQRPAWPRSAVSRSPSTTSAERRTTATWSPCARCASDGEAVSVSGTLTGEDEVEKLVEINGRDFDLRAEGHVLLFEYSDRPGAMGVVGTMLGESDVNIEAAQMSQTRGHSRRRSCCCVSTSPSRRRSSSPSGRPWARGRRG